MKKIVLLCLVGCSGGPAGSTMTVDPNVLDPPHTAYACTASTGVDAGTCIADFRTGSGSDCVFTCENGVCNLTDIVDSGYRAVATCTAPGHCPTFDPPDTGATLSLQVTADVTACLESLCVSVATCAGVERTHPVCVTEVNGGQLLSIYACP